MYVLLTEVADLNWKMLLPKIKVLSAKEADSRTAVQDLMKKQKEEMATFSDEIGMFVTLYRFMLVVELHKPITVWYSAKHVTCKFKNGCITNNGAFYSQIHYPKQPILRTPPPHLLFGTSCTELIL